MFQLLKIEWLKIKSYKTFWLLFLVFCIMYPVTFYFSANKFMEQWSKNKLQDDAIRSMLGSPFEFPRVWQSSGWFGGLFFVMLGMLFILLITNEVQYRTHRQNIIDGWSRMDFLKAKFSVLISFVIISTLLVFISALVVGMIYSPDGSDIFEEVHFVGYFVLMAILYLMVAFLISILIKRTGLSIIIYFAVVCIVDNLLWIILTLKDSQVGYFMPLESADSLLPNPFKPKMLEKRTVTDSTLIAAVAAYLVLFGYIIVSYFRKSDLKT
jgi:ABC-2 type transport system permease protein